MLLPSPPMVKQESSAEPPPSASRIGGLVYHNGTPMLQFQDAVMETVVTHTTCTTTKFAPVALPRVPQPEHIALPNHLPLESYPLAHQPTPPDVQSFALNLAGRRVVVQEDGSDMANAERTGPGPKGWYRTLARDQTADEQIGLVQAFSRAKGKRRHDFEMQREVEKVDRMTAAETSGINTPSPPPATAQRTSPPRKKIRGLDDLAMPQVSGNPLLSPLPSPVNESGPSSATVPNIGTGLELAALYSLPSLMTTFDQLPDKLQQHVLMHMLRRSRMATIQRVASFASIALRRDFITALPHEVAVQILKKVDTRSLAQATRVSKKWHHLIDTERNVWRQRLVDDNMWYGLGVEEEEEAALQKRIGILQLNQEHARAIKADTPEDEPMGTDSLPPPMVDTETEAALKHLYRRRFTSNKHWNRKPRHYTFHGHGTNVVTCLQFDEDKVVSASDDHSINIYDTATGSLRKRLDGHEGGVWALEYKGDTLVSGSTDRTVRIWDLESLSEAHCFHGHTSTVRCLQIVEPVLDAATGKWMPPVPMVVTGSRDATLRVWKLPKKGEAVRRIKTNDDDNIEQLAPERNPWHIHLLEGHSGAVRALAAYGRICVSGSYDATVRVWDIVTGKCLQILQGHEQKVYSIVYDRHRNRCASGSMDNTVKVWNVATGECLQTLNGHTSLVGVLGLSPNYIVSAAADASLRVWDANTYEQKHHLASHGGAITCFQHDETKVVSGSDGTLKLWDIRTGEAIRDLVAGIASVWQVAFNGNLLVAASNRQGTTVFDVFDFGRTEHPSGIDDDRLDEASKRPWEKRNPREPRTYQVDDDPGIGGSSSGVGAGKRKNHNHNQPLSPEQRANYSSTRRSSRLAGRSSGNGSGSGNGAGQASASFRTGGNTTSRRWRAGSSPTPAGPSIVTGIGSGFRNGSTSASGSRFTNSSGSGSGFRNGTTTGSGSGTTIRGILPGVTNRQGSDSFVPTLDDDGVDDDDEAMEEGWGHHGWGNGID
ncbi:WD40-repeat-containing domain protein [Naematelia encephala]|uniref:WD40-repeat-containing domain protein n=1 Tax=Naematelia encephala TaxID=71784 RepID=A0A1Y2AD99_9TREE|nr:WD40-repeat-containing domain protein [Naematelia encephala]